MTPVACRHARRAACAIAWFSAAAAARADVVWSLTTGDFKTDTVTLTAVDDKSLTVAAPDGPRTVALADVVQLSRPAPDRPLSGLVLCTTGGQRLVGTPRRVDGNNLVWFANGIGEVPVPLDQLLAVLRDRTTAAGLTDARADDAIKLGTGDAVHGVVTDVSEAAFTLTPAGGDPVKVAPAAVTSVLFATPPGGRPAVSPPAFLVHVIGGSRVAAASLALAGDKLAVTTPAGPVLAMPLAQVDTIEHTGGRVVWLSGRDPATSVHTPYLDGTYPARIDLTVTGQPIRFAGVTYAHGIGVHSRSVLTYDLQPGDTTFRTRYAVDGNQPLADIDVSVLLDGKPVHTKVGLKSGELSPLVEVSLAGAKTLTLRVDYGKNYDVQDRVNWIEPAIVRDTK